MCSRPGEQGPAASFATCSRAHASCPSGVYHEVVVGGTNVSGIAIISGAIEQARQGEQRHLR